MKDIKHSDLLAILAVFRCRSISLAAIQLGTTQGSVSKIITSVENRLAVKIFDRDHRPLKVTPAGAGLIPYIEKCIYSNNELAHHLDDNQRNMNGIISIFAPSAIQAFLAHNVLHRLKEVHPDINISMVTWNQENNEFHNGIEFSDNCDILISYTLPRNINLVARKIKTLQLNLYATKSFHVQHNFDSLEELSAQPFILLRSMMSHNFNNSFYVVFENSGEKIIKKLEVSGGVVFDNIYTAIQYCRKDTGYLLGYPELFSDFPELIPCLPESIMINIDCYIIYLKNPFQPSRIKNVIQFINDYMFEQ